MSRHITDIDIDAEAPTTTTRAAAAAKSRVATTTTTPSSIPGCRADRPIVAASSTEEEEGEEGGGGGGSQTNDDVVTRAPLPARVRGRGDRAAHLHPGADHDGERALRTLDPKPRHVCSNPASDLTAADSADDDRDEEKNRTLESHFWGRFYVSPYAKSLPDVEMINDAPPAAAAAATQHQEEEIIECIRTYRRAAVERWRCYRALEQKGTAAYFSPRLRLLHGVAKSNRSVAARDVYLKKLSTLQSRIDRLTKFLLTHCLTQYMQYSPAFESATIISLSCTTKEESAAAIAAHASAAAAADVEGGTTTTTNAASNALHAEIDYLSNHCCLEQLLAATRELARVTAHHAPTKPYRLLLVDMDTTLSNKAEILRVINHLETMETTSAEYPKTKRWVDAAFRLPLGRYSGSGGGSGGSVVTVPPPLPGAPLLLRRAWAALEESTYGLLPAKVQILQTLARWIAQPSGGGGALAFHGPPGTGKTSLARRGLCAALGRAFAFIPLGGASQAEFLNGFASTYQDATYGRIAQALIESRCMNPVLYFDELDKIAATEHGREVAQVLIHATDPVQNSEFCDKYFQGIQLSLSQCLIVFSYNDESRVNPVLRDRLTVIHLPGYTEADKLEIARLHLVPEGLANYGFAAGDVVFAPEVLRQMINAVPAEEGVRNLKRAIDAVVGKLNLRRMMATEDARALHAREPTACTREDVVLPHVVLTAEVSNFLAHLQDTNASSGAWRSMFT